MESHPQTPFEPPKSAIIRLLRSQGCCTNEVSPKASMHLQQMKDYRDQLHSQTVQERTRLTQIPCAITLAEQISELKEVLNGLGKQNRGRVDQLTRLHQKVNVHTSVQVNQTDDQREHEKLQLEYANMLRSLEATNEANKRLVERLARW